jgi:hypothetical protein
MESEMKSQLTPEQPARAVNPQTTNKLIVAIALLGFWAHLGFMWPHDLAFKGFEVGTECINFAKKRDVFKADDKLEARSHRIRHGQWVVDVTATNFKGEIDQRTCTVGDGMIWIVSALEAGFWR